MGVLGIEPRTTAYKTVMIDRFTIRPQFIKKIITLSVSSQLYHRYLALNHFTFDQLHLEYHSYEVVLTCSSPVVARPLIAKKLM